MGVPFNNVIGVQASQTNNDKILIVFFSHSGNTRNVAEEIHNLTGGKLVELKNEHPYPSDFSGTVDVAKKEKRENYRPKLINQFPSDMDEYSTIFVGYPVWDYTMPMSLYSFLEKFNFSGKTLIPFSTHEGSGLSNGPEQMARICPKARILPGLGVRGHNSANSEVEVREWLKKIGIPLK